MVDVGREPWSPKFLLCSPEPDDFDVWSPEYLNTVTPGAPNEMLWSPGALICLSWSPGAQNPFGTLFIVIWHSAMLTLRQTHYAHAQTIAVLSYNGKD